MTWSKVDDRFPLNDKVLLAGIDALGFDVAAWCYCNRNLTDGFVAEDKLLLVYPPAARDAQKLADRLVEVGRWRRVEGGFEIHDFHEYNPTAEHVTKTRQARSKAGSKGGSKGGSKRSSKPETNGGADVGATNEAPANPGSQYPPSQEIALSSSTSVGDAVDVDDLIDKIKSKLAPQFEPADLDFAVKRLAMRMQTGDRFTSPISWVETTARNAEKTRRASERANEPKTMDLDGETLTFVDGRWHRADELEDQSS